MPKLKSEIATSTPMVRCIARLPDGAVVGAWEVAEDGERVELCRACEGSGRSSRGGRCEACGGSGRPRTPEEIK